MSSSNTTIRSLQGLGITSSIFLSGTYFSSSHLTLPILYRLPTSISTSIFAEFYHRGVVTVVPLSLIAAGSFGTLAYLVPSERTLWSTAAAASLAPLVWTRLAMMDTIETLLRLEMSECEREKVGTQEVVTLLKRWKWQNMVRSLLALAGGLVGIQAFI